MTTKALKRNIGKFFQDVTGQKTEAAVYQVANEGLALADTYTPVDTSNLINSRFDPVISKTPTQTKAVVGYNAKYAAAVHEMSGKLKGQPRAHFGKTGNRSEFGPQRVTEFGGGTGVGNYWDPHAEPKFLEKGFDDLEVEPILEAIYETK